MLLSVEQKNSSPRIKMDDSIFIRGKMNTRPVVVVPPLLLGGNLLVSFWFLVLFVDGLQG